MVTQLSIPCPGPAPTPKAAEPSLLLLHSVSATHSPATLGTARPSDADPTENLCSDSSLILSRFLL